MSNTNNSTGNEKSEWAKRDVGALWKRESATQKYLSGYVKVDELGIERELKIVVFSNKNKNNNDKAPDYRIYISKPLEKNLNTSEKSQNSAIKNEKAKTKAKTNNFIEKNTNSELEAEEELL